jgi:hypothetical protein
MMRQEDEYLVLEVLDNAPALGAPLEYPSGAGSDGVGLQVCRGIEQALVDAGRDCWFEQARSLQGDEMQELSQLPDLAGVDLKVWNNWTITRFCVAR